MSAHPEKWDKLLNEARASLAKGGEAYIDFTDGDAEGQPTITLHLVADTDEFGLEDQPYAEAD